MKTFLVTGAAGFIGSNMAERLLKEGHNVIGIDNCSTGLEMNVPNNKRMKFYKFDLTNYAALDLVFQENHIDVVMHFAGNASIVNAMTNPTGDVQNNIVTTMNVANACIAHKVTRMLHASTMVVYGADNVGRKETDPCVPTSTYGLTKYAGERYALNCGARTDLGFEFNVTAFRMFNVYGPKQDLENPYQGVVAIFMGHMRSKRDIIIHGNGEQTRDFIYIDDVLEAWIKSIDNKKTYGEVFNLGSGTDLSIKYILDNVMKKMATNSIYQISVIRQPERQGDIKRCVSDSNKLQKAIKWKPKIEFEEGLDKFVNYVRGK
jgi:UDP-glucose 4-epimerase